MGSTSSSSEWLSERWGGYTSASRRHVLFLVTGLVVANSSWNFMLSDGFIAKFDDNLDTPLVELAFAHALVFIFASGYVAGFGGGTAALMGMLRANGWPIFFLSVSGFAGSVCQYAATYVISEVALTITMLAMPLLIPFTAVCFERERNGEVRQYGLWPCLVPATATNPHWGVFPGIVATVVPCIMAIARFNTLTSAIGIAYAVLGLLTQTAANVTAAVLMGRDHPELRTPVVLCWWVSLITTPLALIASLPLDEGARFVNFANERGAIAVLIHSIAAFVGAAAILCRFALIHTASVLTTSLVLDISLAVGGFAVLSLHAPGGGWGNTLGLCLLPFGAAVHVLYMRQRQRMRTELSTRKRESASLDAGSTIAKELLPATERSPLQGGAGSGDGGCEIA